MKTRTECWKIKVYFYLTTYVRSLPKELVTYVKKKPKNRRNRRKEERDKEGNYTWIWIAADRNKNNIIDFENKCIRDIGLPNITDTEVCRRK